MQLNCGVPQEQSYSQSHVVFSDVDLGLGYKLSEKFIHLGENVSDRLAVTEADILT